MNKDLIKESKVPTSPKKCYLPARFVLTFFLFWAMSLEYAHRNCINVTIVVMVNTTALNTKNTTMDDDKSCPDPQTFSNETDLKKNEGEYIWSPSVQGIILGAYFYGYICTQIVGGRMAEVAGGKWPLGLSILAGSLLTLITPIAADIGVAAIVIVRMIMGLVHGLCLPTAFALLAQWSPEEERSTLLSLCIIGDHVGTVLSMPLTGYLCDHGFAGGWPSVYYVLGLLGCVWFVFWVCIAYSKPSDHPRISKEEINYIQKSHSHIQMGDHHKFPIPWKKVLTSMPVWSTVIVMFCVGWGQFTLLTKLPTYLDRILHMPIEENSIVNSVIYLCCCVTLFFSGYLSDYLNSSKKFCPTKVRKGFQIVAMLGPAFCTSIIPFVGCQTGLAVALLGIAMGFLGMCGGGHVPLPADMAPHHSATIFGFVNAFACTSGILAPLVAGFILDNAHASIEQWSSVFYLSSASYLIGLLVFLIWGSAEKQSWAHVHSKEEPLIYPDLKKESIMSTKRYDLEENYKYGSIP